MGASQESGRNHLGSAGGARATGMPRWVKVFVLVVAVLLLVMLAVMLLSGGEHGPGRHGTADGVGVGRPSVGTAAGQGAVEW